jgi:hypothetical protein
LIDCCRNSKRLRIVGRSVNQDTNFGLIHESEPRSALRHRFLSQIERIKRGKYYRNSFNFGY